MAGWVPLRCAIRRNTDANEAVSMSLLELDSTRNFNCQLRSYTGGLTNDLALFALACTAPSRLPPNPQSTATPGFRCARSSLLASERAGRQDGRNLFRLESNRPSLPPGSPPRPPAPELPVRYTPRMSARCVRLRRAVRSRRSRLGQRFPWLCCRARR